MKPFVVIRKLEGQDNLQCQNVVKDFIMAGAWDAFVSCLFREVCLDFCVVTYANQCFCIDGDFHALECEIDFLPRNPIRISCDEWKRTLIDNLYHYYRL